MERIEWIDFLRGISMILILVFHTEVYYKEYDVTPYYIYTTNAIVLFYFISGYLFYRQDEFQWKNKIKNIVRSLIIPYFIFTTLIAFPKILIRQENIDWVESIYNILSGRASWFIASLIVGELFFTAVLVKTNGKILWLSITAAACFIIYYIIPFNQHNYWQWQDALLAVFFLYIGYIYHHFENDFHSINNSLYTFLLLSIFIIIKIYEYHLDLPMRNIAIENSLLFLADVGIFLLFIISHIKYIPKCKFIEWTGKHCIVYYFLAGGCPIFVSMIFNKIGFSYDDYLYRYILAIILVYLVASGLTWIIYRYLPFLVSKNILLILLCCSAISVKAQVDKIPLPVLHIQTVDGEMPTRTIIDAPKGCLGTSITNNNYVPGRMVMTLKGDILYDTEEYEKNISGMRIKIRGNSTGAYLNQHPYKIKLSKKYDLLRRDDPNYQHKEWLLLSMYTWNPKLTNQQSNILYMLGLIVSKIISKEWTPTYELVNVEINGEYQGMYYLMESVSRGDARVILNKTGFMIEHDPFWWNENAFFKTDSQTNNYYRFTYKYPDSDDVTEEIQNTIQNYMNDVENTIYNHGNITQCIDILSFVKWILIHDVLGTDDTVGCNRFLYRKDSHSLLQMGPVWDFDSSFRSDGISTLHTSDIFYFPYLFSQSEFTQVYINLWNSIKPTLLDDIKNEFETLWVKYGDVFDESMSIHQNKYPSEGENSFRFQIDEIVDKVKDRINIVDNYINTTSIHHTLLYNTKEKDNILYHLNGQRMNSINNLRKGIYIYNGRKVVIYK